MAIIEYSSSILLNNNIPQYSSLHRYERWISRNPGLPIEADKDRIHKLIDAKNETKDLELDNETDKDEHIWKYVLIIFSCSIGGCTLLIFLYYTSCAGVGLLAT